MFVVDRFGDAGLHFILWKTLHPDGTNDYWKPGVLHHLPVRPWEQHQGGCSIEFTFFE